MLCDTCTKATVCRLKEDCNRLERSLKPKAVEDILSVDVKCKEYKQINYTLTKTQPIFQQPWQPTCIDRTIRWQKGGDPYGRAWL